MILAIVLVLLMLFCAVAEFCRIWIIAQGVKEAAQQAVISTVNDNYDDVYHAVREGYAAGWYPDGTGRWDESIDTGDVYGQLSETLGLENAAQGYQKLSGGEVEYTISGLSVELENNGLTAYFEYRKSGQFEWAAPAILFACLVFTLTAPMYLWDIVGI